MCWETACMLMAYGSASSLTVASPSLSRATMSRLVRSLSAVNRESSRRSSTAMLMALLKHLLYQVSTGGTHVTHIAGLDQRADMQQPRSENRGAEGTCPWGVALALTDRGTAEKRSARIGRHGWGRSYL